MLHVEEDEIDIVVCREGNGVRARVDRDAEGHLVLVEQPDEAGLGHRLRILLSVHDERGRRHGEDHDECKPRGAHSRFPGHALTPTGVMAIRCKQFHLPDL